MAAGAPAYRTPLRQLGASVCSGQPAPGKGPDTRRIDRADDDPPAPRLPDHSQTASHGDVERNRSPRPGIPAGHRLDDPLHKLTRRQPEPHLAIKSHDTQPGAAVLHINQPAATSA